MSVKLLNEQYLEFLSLKGDCTDSSESTLVKMPHCWKSHVTAQLKLRFQRKLMSLNHPNQSLWPKNIVSDFSAGLIKFVSTAIFMKIPYNFCFAF